MENIGPQSKPIDIFNEWMAQAKKMEGVREATAMSVSTVTLAGEVQSRMVLCKDWSEEGFKFYTNYDSPKGDEIEADPNVALLFYWDPWFRQVRISGRAVKTSREDSVAYWNSRPRASQISQWISDQSAPVTSRQELEQKWKAAESKFNTSPVPCPEHWGGYLVRPEKIEFWVGQPNRLHDRYLFEQKPSKEKASPSWTFRRLSP